MSAGDNPYAPPREPPPDPPGAAPAPAPASATAVEPAAARGAPSFAKLAMLASLYFAQGLPFGYFTLVLPNLLRERGASLVAVSLSQGLALPWALKFLWAPLVDRHGSAAFGRRKSWIVPLQAVMVGLLLGLALLADRASITLFVAGVFFANLLAATQDIATDGLAVDILTPSERGFANGIQVGGYRAGMILGGSAIGLLLVRYGAPAAYVSMALLLVTATVPVFFAREARAPAPPPPPPPPPLSSSASPSLASAASPSPVAARLDRAAHFLLRPDAPRLLALIAIYKLGDAFATAMVKPFVRDHGFTLEDQIYLLGMYGSVAGMLGALAGGALIGPLGRRRALVIFGALQVVSLGGYACVAAGLGGRALVYGATAVEHFVSGMATAALFTVMMDACRPERAATDYTVQASAFVIAGGAVQMLSGFFAEPFGYLAHFAVAAALAAASVPAVLWLSPRSFPGRTRRVEGARAEIDRGTS